MQTIWKFPFQIEHKITIEMPEGAVLLHVDVQQNTPCIWAVVNPRAAAKPRQLRLYGTGTPIEEKLGTHVGSFQMRNGLLVWHVFEVVPDQILNKINSVTKTTAKYILCALQRDT